MEIKKLLQQVEAKRMEQSGLEQESDSGDEESADKKLQAEESKNIQLQKQDEAARKVWGSIIRNITHKDLPELQALRYKKKQVRFRSWVFGNDDYSRWENYADLKGISNDIVGILAFLLLVTPVKAEDIELMMNAHHEKMMKKFDDEYKQLKSDKKKRLADQKAFKETNPDATEEELKEIGQDEENVLLIYFTGHGTASSEAIPNGTM